MTMSQRWDGASSLHTSNTSSAHNCSTKTSGPSLSASGDGSVVESGTAILWGLICMPIGFGLWGQGTKGWAWVGISFITCGMGGVAALADYVMCYNAQQKRKLEEWEFFPK